MTIFWNLMNQSGYFLGIPTTEMQSQSQPCEIIIMWNVYLVLYFYVFAWKSLFDGLTWTLCSSLYKLQTYMSVLWYLSTSIKIWREDGPLLCLLLWKLKMARKPVKLQKENPPGCAREGKQSKGNYEKRKGRLKDNRQ